VGLSNTRERLEKLFPQCHVFHAGPESARGFAVRIESPFECEARPEASLPEVANAATYADRG
jgi:hypothetical protein